MESTPRISCIMPTTAARLPFISQAIRYFNEQDYPDKELIIIDSGKQHGTPEVFPHIPLQPNIRYLYVDARYEEGANAVRPFGGGYWDLTIGAKRNLAYAMATGDIICHWDDDDYYGPDRLSVQVAPILARDASVTAMKMSLCYDVERKELWHCTDALHQRLFSHDVRSGTLMYVREFGNHDDLCYPNTSHGEDALLLYRLLQRGKALQQIISPSSYICIRHGSNVSDGMEYGEPGWIKADVHRYLSPSVLDFYLSLAEAEAEHERDNNLVLV